MLEILQLVNVNYLDVDFVGVQYVSGKTYNPITLAEEDSYYLSNLNPFFHECKGLYSIRGFWMV